MGSQLKQKGKQATEREGWKREAVEGVREGATEGGEIRG
jgi:hypothetical protein